MVTKRIIPCLDVKDGRTVKGVNFEGLRDAGDPVELGKLYAQEGADELVFLDITATHEKRKTLARLVERVAREVTIPFTVGGGISSEEDVKVLLNAGADKVSVNSAAVKDPSLIDRLSDRFGTQCIVAAIDARRMQDGQWKVHVSGGRKPTDRELFFWASELESRGAGEILFTSMDHDGVKQGFAVEAVRQMIDTVRIPVIASGGAGNIEHFREVFLEGKADAALAASIFHFKEVRLCDLKARMQQWKIPVRI